ncbi:MAG: dicarboxylate/amino acid:cation symporter [Bacteroidales bacterium]|nr:dicarboxylate/amino acid:cation symporter [Bacteroidales bacterium]
MKKGKKKYPVWLKILIGMFLGIIWGLIATRANLEEFTANWVKPWGIIFIKLLKLIAVPIIFISLVKGITSVTDVAKLSRIGLKTLALYVATTALTVVLGLVVVNAFKPGESFSEEKRKELQQVYASSAAEKQEVAGSVTEQSPLFFFEDMVPDNIVKAAGDNSKMLQIIFFAVIFSIAMILLEASKVVAVRNLIDSVNDIMLKIVDLIMAYAPIGVFALLSALITDFAGDKQLFVALGKYAVITFFGIVGILVILYPLMIFLFTRTRVKDFMNAIFPAQLVAFTTSSSAATLPVTIKQCTEKLHISEGVANFVLPVGVTINMNGSSFYQAISAVFIAQVFGLDLTIGQQMTIVLTATLASIGAPGVPGGAVIMLVIVLGSVGIPAEGLALILGIERPLDMIRTVANVTGDATVATIIEASESRRTPVTENTPVP